VTAGVGTFIGAVADAPITSFRLSLVDVPDLEEWPAANNLILATAVPEPALPAITAAAAGLLLAARRRRR
jgi:hypothetical protein